MKKIISKSPTQTKNLAEKLAKNFQGGEVFGLVGNLGSGKTQFTKGLAEYFKIQNHITSPTFVLMKIYKIKNPKIKNLIHIDAYRLESLEELEMLGLSDYINQKNNLIIIEWADKIKNALPKNTQYIKFKTLNETSREIIIK